ncbi:MAG: hypothetical protein K8H88_10080, partial [Sandaracinaceae bacterium]|nr:hypothetical protein [Sandaracinaceae bacterium]
MRPWQAVLAVALLLVVVATGVGTTRIDQLAAGELDVLEQVTLREAAARPGATAESAPLIASVRLEREHEVTFDLCAEDPMREERWAGALAVAVWRPRAQELMVRTELTPQVLDRARRTDQQGCLEIGSGRIGASDDYAVEALWTSRPEALIDVPLYVRVSARRPLGWRDLWLVLLAWIGSLAGSRAAGRR